MPEKGKNIEKKIEIKDFPDFDIALEKIIEECWEEFSEMDRKYAQDYSLLASQVPGYEVK